MRQPPSAEGVLSVPLSYFTDLTDFMSSDLIQITLRGHGYAPLYPFLDACRLTLNAQRMPLNSTAQLRIALTSALNGSNRSKGIGRSIGTPAS